MNKKRILFISIFITLLIACVLLPYFYIFKDSPISSNNVDWANFGSYVGGTFNIFTTIFACISAFILYNTYIETKEMNNNNYSLYIKESMLSQFTLFLNLGIDKLEQVKKEFRDRYGATDHREIFNDLYDTHKDGQEKIHSNLFEKLTKKEFISNQKDFIYKLSKEMFDSYHFMDLSMILLAMHDLIEKQDDEQFKIKLKILLRSKFDNNTLYWSLMYVTKGNNLESPLNIDGYCRIPYEVKEALEECRTSKGTMIIIYLYCSLTYCFYL